MAAGGLIVSTRTLRRDSATSLLIIALAFVVAVSITNQLFNRWRVDLTEDNLYTLSPGTEHLVEGIDEPINLYFYYSDGRQISKAGRTAA